VDLLIKNNDFPWFYVCLPEDISWAFNSPKFAIHTTRSDINMFNIVSIFQDENSADVLPTKKCNGFTAVHLIHFIKSMAIPGSDLLEVPTIYKAYVRAI
jgi:hypothetical protein